MQQDLFSAFDNYSRHLTGPSVSKFIQLFELLDLDSKLTEVYLQADQLYNPIFNDDLKAFIEKTIGLGTFFEEDFYNNFARFDNDARIDRYKKALQTRNTKLINFLNFHFPFDAISAFLANNARNSDNALLHGFLVRLNSIGEITNNISRVLGQENEVDKRLNILQEPNYIVDDEILARFYQSFKQFWSRGLTQSQFIACFDRNNAPPIKLITFIAKGHISKFALALSWFKNDTAPNYKPGSEKKSDLITEKVAEQRFGFEVGQFRKVKSDARKTDFDSEITRRKFQEILKSK